MEALAPVIVIVLIVMYFGRAIKASAGAVEESIVLGADVIEHHSSKVYGRLDTEATKLYGKGKYSTRKSFKQTRKNLGKEVK